MQIWLVHDRDPRGGFYSAWSFRPTLGVDLRGSEDEVRTIDVPASLWDDAINARLPVDADESNDSTWATYWPDAEVVWARTDEIDPVSPAVAGRWGVEAAIPTEGTPAV